MSDDLPAWVQQYRWELGARVRALRQAAGLSQIELGERAGVDNKTVSRVENGIYNIGIDYVFALARALGVEPWSLFRDD